MPDETPDEIDYHLSEDEIRYSLREFGIQKNEISKMMLDVMQLITSRDFYVNYDTRYNLPDYAFQPTNIIEAGGYRENTRESVRKDALKPLRSKGVLGYDEPVPNSPKTHYYLSQEFREYLDSTELDTVISQPDPAEGKIREVELPYHGEVLNRAAGEHAELIADGLKILTPQISKNPVLVHEGLDKSEREDIESKMLPIEFAGYRFLLSVYPDAVVFDEATTSLYLLESVTNRGPFTDQRIQTILQDLSEPQSKIGEWETGKTRIDVLTVIFVTMFPDVGRYRTHLMSIGDGSYVWLSDHPEELRLAGKMGIPADLHTAEQTHLFEVRI